MKISLIALVAMPACTNGGSGSSRGQVAPVANSPTPSGPGRTPEAPSSDASRALVVRPLPGNLELIFDPSSQTAVVVPEQIEFSVQLVSLNANVGFISHHDGATYAEKCASYKKLVLDEVASLEELQTELNSPSTGEDSKPILVSQVESLRKSIQILVENGTFDLGYYNLRYVMPPESLIETAKAHWPTDLPSAKSISVAAQSSYRFDVSSSTAGLHSLTFLAKDIRTPEFATVFNRQNRIANFNEYCDMVSGPNEFVFKYAGSNRPVRAKITAIN